MRSAGLTPRIIQLAVMFETDPTGAEEIFDKVIETPLMLSDLLSYVMVRRGKKSFSNPLTRSAGKWLMDVMTEKMAEEYGFGRDVEGEFTLKDMLKLIHPGVHRNSPPNPLFSIIFIRSLE